MVEAPMEELKCTTMGFGEQYVTMIGIVMMPK